MGMPAARVGDLTSHAPPLSPGPGSPNVFIGGQPAWRALPAAMGMALDAAQKVADAIVKTAESATMASDPLTKAGFLAAEAAAKTAATTALTAMMNVMGGACMGLTLGKGQPDKHMCTIPTAPAPAPHGMGMVIDGSGCVLTNGLPQSAQGDKVLEALGGPDPIAQGLPTVLVGKCGGGGGLFAAVASLVQQAIDSVLKAANAVAAFVKDAVGFVKGLVQAVIDKVVAAARRITQAVVDAVVDGLKKLSKAVQDALKSKFQKNKEKAIENIKNSKFGKTPEGQKVIKKIEALEADGKIVSEDLGESTRGEWSDGKIKVGKAYEDDPDAVASELVHEATHAVNEDDFPASKTKLTIDEEMRTNENQLDYYEEQRAGGFRDPELEDRRNDRAAGKLRDNVRKRYPKSAEHL